MKQYTARLILVFKISFFAYSAYGQADIRIYSTFRPESLIFKVASGEYTVGVPGNETVLGTEELALITKYGDKLAFKIRGSRAIALDSVIFKAVKPGSTFSIRLDGENTSRQIYRDDLRVKPDLGTIVMINRCDENSYIAGVVSAEAGSGRAPEFYKAQSVIARTYMYKYINKHSSDGYNLCDDIHCQAFKGLTAEKSINDAVEKTNGMVILGPDGTLIISAFHSNCGGETVSADEVWLTKVPYLRKKTDPYCISSRNASWEKSMSLSDWNNAIMSLAELKTNLSSSQAAYDQKSRATHYKTVHVNIPFTDIRNQLGLRSSFFSVIPSGENVILKGRGYGHGVGLCQEGAMNMALKGFGFEEIIKFYYTDVTISEITAAKLESTVK